MPASKASCNVKSWGLAVAEDPTLVYMATTRFEGEEGEPFRVAYVKFETKSSWVWLER